MSVIRAVESIVRCLSYTLVVTPAQLMNVRAIPVGPIPPPSPFMNMPTEAPKHITSRLVIKKASRIYIYASVSPNTLCFCVGCTVLDQLAATSLRSTLLSILDDLERKEAIVQNLLRETQSQQTKEMNSDEMISESAKNIGEIQVAPVQQALTKVPGICSQEQDVSERQGFEMKLPQTKEQLVDTAISRVGVIVLSHIKGCVCAC